MLDEGASTDGNVTLGRIASAHGIKGWVNVQSHTRPAENLLEFEDWLIGDKAYRVAESRRAGQRLQVKLESVDDRTAAETIRGQWIQVPRDAMPEPEAGEYFWVDLIGLRVRTSDGADLGKVDGLMDTGANDVLVVEGERQRLVPFDQDNVIQRIDLDEGEILVDWDPAF